MGTPRRVDDRGSQVLKALKQIRAEDYYQAERKGLVLYLEGSTDLAILRSVADLLDHPAKAVLSEPFVTYVANHPRDAENHFYGLRQAKPDLKSFALFDRVDIDPRFSLPHHVWSRREIENYVASRDVLLRFAADTGPDDLVARAHATAQAEAMETAIASVESAFRTLRRDPWSPDEKMSDDVLEPIFASNRMQKTNYHVLVQAMVPADVPDEMRQVLDQLVAAAPAA